MRVCSIGANAWLTSHVSLTETSLDHQTGILICVLDVASSTYALEIFSQAISLSGTFALISETLVNLFANLLVFSRIHAMVWVAYQQAAGSKYMFHHFPISDQ